MKKWVAGLLCALLLLPGQSVLAQEISVILEGQVLSCDPGPVMAEDRVLVPFRALFDALGYTVTWDEATGKIGATGAQHTLGLQVGSAQAWVDGAERTLDVPVQIREDRAYVPVRFVGEASGYVVNWVPAEQQVVITAPADITSLPLPFDFAAQDLSALAAYIQNTQDASFALADYTLSAKEVIANNAGTRDGSLRLTYGQQGFATGYEFVVTVENGWITDVRKSGEKPQTALDLPPAETVAAWEEAVCADARNQCQINVDRGWTITEVTLSRRYTTEAYGLVTVTLMADNGEEFVRGFTYYLDDYLAGNLAPAETG